MAAGLPDAGELITCDINPETTRIAQSFWARSPHGGKIKPALGPALETINTLPAEMRFDFVFLDADDVHGCTSAAKRRDARERPRKITCATTKRCYRASDPAGYWLPTTPSSHSGS
jgi:hypothetical protein